MKKRLDRDHGIFASLAMTMAIAVLGIICFVDLYFRHLIFSKPFFLSQGCPQ